MTSNTILPVFTALPDNEISNERLKKAMPNMEDIRIIITEEIVLIRLRRAGFLTRLIKIVGTNGKHTSNNKNVGIYLLSPSERVCCL